MKGRASLKKGRREGECREQVGPVVLCKVDVWALTHLLTCLGGATGIKHRGDMIVCVFVYFSVFDKNQRERESETKKEWDRERVRVFTQDLCLTSAKMFKKKESSKDTKNGTLKVSGKISKWVIHCGFYECVYECGDTVSLSCSSCSCSSKAKNCVMFPVCSCCPLSLCASVLWFIILQV